MNGTKTPSTDGAEPLYLGFDLSTQQLKGLAVNSDLKVIYEAHFDFDDDSTGFDIDKGVISNEKEGEVYAPVKMWLQALDGVLQRLGDKGMNFSRVKGISGAGQQHGSVYWGMEAESLLQGLDSKKALEAQLGHAFSYPFSPNWQDASTQKQCEAFDQHLGNAEELAVKTGSKAHHRFTGPQILRFQQKHHEAYEQTSRISLVSSFLASVFLGRVAPIDIGDVCGMNLWDMKAGCWHKELMALTCGSSKTDDLERNLGEVPEDGGQRLGDISPYFVQRYGFESSCSVTAFTGDNPSTILALPLRPHDAMVSLGTSTTFLMSTPQYKPDPAVHFMNHPATPGLHMFMLCYKNGGLAREQVRDALNGDSSESWQKFSDIASKAPPLGQTKETDPMKIGLYFPRPEIVPNVRAGEWHFNYDPSAKSISETESGWSRPHDDARAIVESQMLSLRLRSHNLVESPGGDLPPQPRRIYLVGGASQNPAIAQIAGEVLGGAEGIYKLDMGSDACALGAAYKAVWAAERKEDEKFEDLIGARWKEDDFIEKIAPGYQKGVFEKYGEVLEGFDKMEKEVVAREKKLRSQGK